MKIKKISLALIVTCLSGSLAYSQNAKVQTAYNFYKPEYKQYDKAKEAIDEAVLNEKTSTSAKAWYYRGLIYQALYKDKNYGSLCNNCLQIAFESYKKSLELDPKNEWVDIINSLQIPAIVNQEFNQGVEFFKKCRFVFVAFGLN